MSGWQHKGGPCPKCQEPVKAGATRCPHCRANLAPAVRTMWIVISVLAVVLVGYVVLHVVGRRQEVDSYRRCLETARDISVCRP